MTASMPAAAAAWIESSNGKKASDEKQKPPLNQFFPKGRSGSNQGEDKRNEGDDGGSSGIGLEDAIDEKQGPIATTAHDRFYIVLLNDIVLSPG